jgi:hypothetical protein
VVVYSDGERLFGGLLADDVFLEEVIDFFRLRQFEVTDGLSCSLRLALIDDFVTQLDALVADVHPGTSDELLDLFLALSTKRALK